MIAATGDLAGITLKISYGAIWDRYCWRRERRRMIDHTLPDQLSTEVFFCDREPHEFADELVRILANLDAKRTLVVTGGRAARPWLPGLLEVLHGHCVIAREECQS